MTAQNGTRHALIQQIHAKGSAEKDANLVICVTGGGSLVISDLLTVPGASRTLLGSFVPYSNESLEQFLYNKPDKVCNELTGRLIAVRARDEAMHVLHHRKMVEAYEQKSEFDSDAVQFGVGLGCTASLASDRPKRGAHRVHIAWQTKSSTTSISLELEKGARTRFEEERLVADLLINAAAEIVGLNERLSLELKGSERLLRQEEIAPVCLQQLLFPEYRVVESKLDRAVRVDSDWQKLESVSSVSGPRVIFPGSFNPLHQGHIEMARIASEILGLPTEFEISVTNVDKSPLDFIEMRTRAAQFQSPSHFATGATLWLTNAQTFLEKSAIFPNATFVVGTDTILRIADYRYADFDEAKMLAGIKQIASVGCRFLVFGRTDKTTNEFTTLSQCQLPDELREICTEVPPERFRSDISSTELRHAQEAADST